MKERTQGREENYFDWLPNHLYLNFILSYLDVSSIINILLAYSSEKLPLVNKHVLSSLININSFYSDNIHFLSFLFIKRNNHELKQYFERIYKYTPLHYAAMINQHFSELKLSFSTEADRKSHLNAVNVYNETPLLIAARLGYYVNVCYLLSDDCVDFKIPNNRNFTPYSIAIKYGHADIVEYMINKKANFCITEGDIFCDAKYPSYSAVYHARLDVLEVLLKYGHLLVNEEVNHRQLICVAAETGDTNIIKFLLSIGANVNASELSNYWKTPLGCATSSNHLKAVEFLLENGAEANQTCYVPGGLSAIHLAVKHNHFQLIPVLVKHGADIDDAPLGNLFHTPLSLAKSLKHWHAALYLLASGATYKSHNILTISCTKFFSLTQTDGLIIEDRPFIADAILTLEDQAEKMRFLEMVFGQNESPLKKYMHHKIGLFAPSAEDTSDPLYPLHQEYLRVTNSEDVQLRTAHGI